jgi:uncharacterized Zn finger protein
MKADKPKNPACKNCGKETEIFGVLIQDDLQILHCKECGAMMLPYKRKSELIYKG